MEFCTKSSQFRAATAQWQRLLQGEWPDFEGATVPKEQASATIPADSPIRRLYLLALIDATKHPQIHGHLTPAPAEPDRRADSTRADEGDDGHAHDLPGDDEPDADPRPAERERQPRHDRSPRRLAETPGGSGDEGVAGSAAGEHDEVIILIVATFGRL